MYEMLATQCQKDLALNVDAKEAYLKSTIYICVIKELDALYFIFFILCCAKF
jgi:hypothetical protein